MYLYFNDFITEKQNEQINKKTKRFQEKNKVSINMEQLSSVDYVYNDSIDELVERWNRKI